MRNSRVKRNKVRELTTSPSHSFWYSVGSTGCISQIPCHQYRLFVLLDYCITTRHSNSISIAKHISVISVFFILAQSWRCVCCDVYFCFSSLCSFRSSIQMLSLRIQMLRLASNILMLDAGGSEKKTSGFAKFCSAEKMKTEKLRATTNLPRWCARSQGSRQGHRRCCRKHRRACPGRIRACRCSSHRWNPWWRKTSIRGTYGSQRLTRANRSKDETKLAYQVQGASSSIWPRVSMRIIGTEARIFL